MTYEEIRARWRTRALRNTTNLIESLCELRDLLVELPTQRMQLINDFASDFGRSKATVKDDLHIIGGYLAEDMQRWVVAGIRFDHMEKAKQVAAAKEMTPAALLDFAIDNGPEGKTMTVDEMVSFAIGEKPSGGARRNFQRYYDRLMKLPAVYKWDDSKRARFEQVINTLWEFFE